MEFHSYFTSREYTDAIIILTCFNALFGTICHLLYFVNNIIDFDQLHVVLLKQLPVIYSEASEINKWINKWEFDH